MRRVLSVTTIAAAIGALCVSAEAGVLVPLPAVPGSVTTYAEAINNNNMIAGNYSAPDGAYHGFVGTLDGNYTTFDVLGGNVAVRGLNDGGYITGFSNVETQDCPFLGCEFLRKPDGTIVPIKKDGKPLDGIAAQIIAHQKFVGQYYYTDDQGDLQSSGDYGKGARYVSDFVLPPELKSGLTEPRGLMQNGTVTGWFAHQDGLHPQSGFVALDGVATPYDYPDPNAAITQFEHANKKGLVAGAWYNSGQTTSGAFVFDSRRARFKPIDVPGASLPFASSVNDAGIVTLGDGDGSSYIYCPHKKTCPLQAGAIEIPERWIAARPVPIHLSSNNAAHRVPETGRRILKESGSSFWH